MLIICGGAAFIAVLLGAILHLWGVVNWAGAAGVGIGGLMQAGAQTRGDKTPEHENLAIRGAAFVGVGGILIAWATLAGFLPHYSEWSWLG